MTKIVFVSDFFVNEVAGGAELCNDALIKLLETKFEVIRIKSQFLTEKVVFENKKKKFIIANFFNMSEVVKSLLEKDCDYIILEHDHKYVKTNNPSLFKNFLAPESNIINKKFYAGASAICCQSKIHSQVLQKNLMLSNIVNLGGNLWTDEQLTILRENMGSPKTIEYGVLESNNKNKGFPAALDYCKKNKLNFEVIPHQSYVDFIKNISKVKNLVFFPQWLETFNRLSIEARILGCNLITNGLIGAASEDYFKLKNDEMLTFIEENNVSLINTWVNLIRKNNVKYIPEINLPKVTVFCPLYSGEEHIKGFLQSMKAQTIFEECELIIIDANSPENERETIEEFIKTNKNVSYRRLDYRASVMETENMAIEMATGEFFAQACVDDRHSEVYLETLAKHLHFDKEVDLVYSDCYQTHHPNETYDSNTAEGSLYEHSRNKFSRENMIKCLPGPMPMWRIKVHKEVGLFDNNLSYAGDWELFLRMVDHGCVFKKIDIPMGLYYYNSQGLSTSTSNSKPRLKEEASVFFKYSHVFGENNFKRYKPYFEQFTKEKQ